MTGWWVRTTTGVAFHHVPRKYATRTTCGRPLRYGCGGQRKTPIGPRCKWCVGRL